MKSWENSQTLVILGQLTNVQHTKNHQGGGGQPDGNRVLKAQDAFIGDQNNASQTVIFTWSDVCAGKLRSKHKHCR